MGAVTETGDLYSAPVAFIYIFNLIIGVGALTMPKAFGAAGWLVSIIVICILAFMSFVTTTFMVEAMAAANAILRIKQKNKTQVQNETKQVIAGSAEQNPTELSSPEEEEAFEENEPLINFSKLEKEKSLYEITTRVEMGQMAKMVYSKNGLRLFYVCIILYLYGDLAIYAAAVPKSLTLVSCPVSSSSSKHHSNFTNHSHWDNITASKQDNCWGDISKDNVYRIYLLIFTVALGPFAFFNVQKTKYLQMLTTVMRWLAFSMMIVLAVMRILNGTKIPHNVSVAQFSGVPNLFGVCIYAFMCQHSLPSFITPMKSKSRVTFIFSLDFGIILLFYSLLSFSAMFAFKDLYDLYTLNFQEYTPFIHYFLALFPVFTLSTNFPIISITLRDNLKNLFYREGRPYHWIIDRIVFPLATILPPIGVAFATQNLEILVGVTGSYAGAGVQYVIPATLVYYGRKEIRRLINIYDNKHRSIFRQRSWVYFVLIWTVVCVAFVTANHIVTRK